MSEHPHPEPRSYPLMLRTWSYEWWRPSVGIVFAVLLFFVVPLVLTPVLMLGVALDHQGSFSDALKQAGTLKHLTWPAMLWLNLSLAGMVPATWGLLRLLHGLRPRWLASVLPGFRWRFFWACFGVALVAIATQLLLGAFLPGDPNNLNASGHLETGRLVGLAIVIALTTPLQAMGEEYAFRGYLLQAFGSLTRQPWFGIVLSAALFALAHGAQNWPLFLDRFSFGLVAAFIVYRTGGLEAGIALHVWNNLIAFGVALGLGNIDATLNVHEISWWNIPLTITQNGVYLVLVLLIARRMGVRRTTDPSPQGSPVLLPRTPSV